MLSVSSCMLGISFHLAGYWLLPCRLSYLLVIICASYHMCHYQLSFVLVIGVITCAIFLCYHLCHLSVITLLGISYHLAGYHTCWYYVCGLSYVLVISYHICQLSVITYTSYQLSHMPVISYHLAGYHTCWCRLSVSTCAGFCVSRLSHM